MLLPINSYIGCISIQVPHIYVNSSFTAIKSGHYDSFLYLVCHYASVFKGVAKLAQISSMHQHNLL
jgi:hypothetical protein